MGHVDHLGYVFVSARRFLGDAAAADLILADDNFASIVAGIEEGRIAYDNVRKVVYLLVSTGAAEIVLFMLAFGSGLLMVLFENIHVFNCRSERRPAFKVPIANNLLLIGAVVAAQLVHIAAMYVPGMQLVLGVLIVMEVYKLLWGPYE